ncbi:S-protein homolog 5-like [Gastrolobium bilobum]|uniref:S-protein homolog 5-like n=1 Tax=Gastrolobium bilobum TaxID=150636 RepID=UPI002AB1BB90|nr:S-protein homolog 5-like [Gastrolobium bilobum]
MVSVSRIMLPLSMFLTILLASKFKAGESGIFTDNVKVLITNKLTNMLLGLHCKDKNHDLGFQVLQVGQTYSFEFQITLILNKLYYCSFNWRTGSHYFDIYDQVRDNCTFCVWHIYATGPCLVRKDDLDCFHWNTIAHGGRHLSKGNNTLEV